MSFDATVYRVLVASPADVGDERNVIPEVISEWNAVSAVELKALLMPVRWETHSAPLLGGRPQAIINDQMVKNCDLLVGVFWSRIGTHTGIAVSGTAEEIEQFVQMEKPVMLYFSQSPIDPDKIEIDQFTALRNFKERMRLKGLTESYSGIPDFRQKFSRQLAINLNSVLKKTLGSAVTKATPIGGRGTKQKNQATGKKMLSVGPLVLDAAIDTSKLTEEQVHDFLTRAVHSTARGDGWANIAALGLYLRTYTPVDYRALGHSTLKKFLQATKLLEIKAEQKSDMATGLDTVSVRLLPKSGSGTLS